MNTTVEQKDGSEHGKRVITAILAVTFGAGVYLTLKHMGIVILSALIAFVATSEFLGLLLDKNQPDSVRRWKLGTTLFLSAAVFFLLLLQSDWSLLPAYLVFFVIFSQALFFSHCDGNLKTHLFDAIVQFTALFYIAGFLSFVPAVHSLAHGPNWLILLLISVWGGDIGAYYGGKTFGRNKLSPNLSPGKTREGTLCGLVFVALLGASYAHFMLPHLPAWKGAMIAGLTSVAAQLGDLLESLVKRVSGVKDSGNLFPGHGGAFDRFDSLILAAPLFYFLVLFLS